jgi:hypothetical protein
MCFWPLLTVAIVGAQAAVVREFGGERTLNLGASIEANDRTGSTTGTRP